MAYGTLDINFEGYFVCRIATDPDPTNEERGMSGYTMALATESPLDQVIRLQVEPDWMERNARPPLPDMPITVGVTVRSVLFQGVPYDGASGLIGATVHLDGADDLLLGPTFESRNNTVGNDDTFAFVVNPFNLRIERHDAGVRLTATDYVDPSDPKRPLWSIADPSVYSRRLPTCAGLGDSEVSEAINVFDAYGYFRDRRRYLEKRIRDASAARAVASSGDERDRLDAEIEGSRSRIFQLERWGDRIINKMQAKVGWEFDVNGPQSAQGDLGGYVDASQPWHVRFWFGGWDGDLLLGYVRGTLGVPFAIVREDSTSNTTGT